LVIVLCVKVRSLTMHFVAHATKAVPLRLPKVISLGATPTPTTVDMVAQWANHISHVPNLLPAEVLILLILIFSMAFKLGCTIYSSYKAKTARTRLDLEIGNVVHNVLVPIIDLPHTAHYYKLVINRQEVEFVLMEANVTAELIWYKGITSTNTVLKMPIILPPRLSVPFWKIKKVRSLLLLPYYADIQIVSNVTTHDMEVVTLCTLAAEAIGPQSLYANLSSLSMTSLSRIG